MVQYTKTLVVYMFCLIQARFACLRCEAGRHFLQSIRYRDIYTYIYIYINKYINKYTLIEF